MKFNLSLLFMIVVFLPGQVAYSEQSNEGAEKEQSNGEIIQEPVVSPNPEPPAGTPGAPDARAYSRDAVDGRVTGAEPERGWFMRLSGVGDA